MLTYNPSSTDASVRIVIVTPEEIEIPYRLPANSNVKGLKQQLSNDLSIDQNAFHLRFLNDYLDDNSLLSTYFTVCLIPSHFSLSYFDRHIRNTVI